MLRNQYLRNLYLKNLYLRNLNIVIHEIKDKHTSFHLNDQIIDRYSKIK